MSEIYLDNNATTPMPRVVVEAITAAANLGNPSSEYVKGHRCASHETLENLRLAIAAQFQVSLDEFAVILTGSGSEANNLIIRSTAAAYRRKTKSRPHIVSSTIEHKTTLTCLEQMRADGEAQVTLVPPNENGHIQPEAVAAALLPNTALVTIMHANNETGAVNRIVEIGRICHEYQFRVPFHTDAVQTFGKTPPSLEPFIDGASVSFHKLHGPAGVGALVLRRELIEVWKIQAQICGSQNEGLRGGTENVLGAAGALMAMQYTFCRRSEKNARMEQCRLEFLRELGKSVRLLTRTQFVNEHTKFLETRREPPPSVVILTPLGEDAAGPRSTCNTLLLSVVDYSRKVCNADMKTYMGKRGVKVSVGSACNTESSKASHVLGDLPPVIKRGTLRISVGDETVPDDVRKAAKLFVRSISEA